MAMATEALDDPTQLFIRIRGWADGHTDPISLLDSVGGGWLWQWAVAGKRRICLTGHGGLGKSYLCRRLAHDVATRLNGSRTPILFPLSSPTLQAARQHGRGLLNAIGRYHHLGDDLGRSASDLAPVFLLDGLDEAGIGHSGTEDDFRKLLEPVCRVEHGSVVLTTRTTALVAKLPQVLRDLKFETITLAEWTKDQSDLKEYFHACARFGIRFPDTIDRFCDQIDANGNIRGLARTPFFARMLAELAESVDVSGVGSVLDLYDQYTDTVISRRMLSQDGGPICERAAITLATDHAHEMSSGILTDAVAPHVMMNQTEVESVFRTNRVGLLAHRVEPNDVLVRFSHVSLEDYYVARVLKDQVDIPEGVQVTFGLFHLNASQVDFLANQLHTDLEALADWLTIASRNRNVFRDTGDEIGQPDFRIAIRNLTLVCLRGDQALKKSKLDRIDLAATDLSGAVLDGCDLEGASFRGARLTNASLQDCVLDSADLRDADLTGARLDRANFASCKVAGIVLSDPHRPPTMCEARGLDSWRQVNDALAQSILADAIERCRHPAHAAWASDARREL